MLPAKLASVVCVITFLVFACQNTTDRLLIKPPNHGFVSKQHASKWEESMLTGNGTIGALVIGDPLNERIILSHEKLFMPEYPPEKAPQLWKQMDKIRELTLNGDGEKAAVLAVELGKQAGIEDLIWTDPLVPACQLEIVSLSEESVLDYARSVNYETAEAMTAWKTKSGVYHRKIFTSRPDQLSVLKMSSPDKLKQDVKIRLSQLPLSESEENSELEDEFDAQKLIEDVKIISKADGTLSYMTLFRKKWEGSLKGYFVETKVIVKNGEKRVDDGWLIVKDADDILILTKIKLSYDLPVKKETDVKKFADESYEALLEKHVKIHGEMFNRFSFNLRSNEKSNITGEDLLKTSSPGKLNNDLLVQLMKAARYILISSTGELPPTLQGIWGGTWRPAWSGDFTLNGNVPSAIACGLNCNFQEVTEAYINYMWSMLEDFKDNARDLYHAPGIFVPSRSSSSGKAYHYLDEYPHLFWYAGNSWTSQFFYDYWQYTGNGKFLKEKAIPFMMASADFYEFILTKDEEGKYMFVPSYSPEVGPIDMHPAAINATMDIAGLKQLLRNLLELTEQGYIANPKTDLWNDILHNLPGYAIDESGDLKEWIWPGYQNDNAHRHASHLYPLFYEVDPAFEKNEALINAAKQAIENRLRYRRNKNGAEMAFGLVQKGLAAAHIGDTEHAYECVDWLCNSYWSPAFTSYHDPGEIFNVDICGGLPAVVTEMIIQSSADEIVLLPALPEPWPEGEIKGVLTRCGVTVDLIWKDHHPVVATMKASRNTKFILKYKDRQWPMELEKDSMVKRVP
jgi:alpha-L-fucosidase 2